MEENRMGRMGDLIKESTIRNYLAGKFEFQFERESKIRSPEIPQAQGWDKIQGKAYQLPAIWKITQRSLMKLRTISQVIMEEFQRKAEQKLFGTINKITFKRIQGRRAMRVVPPNPYPPNPSLPDHRKRIRGTTAVEIASGLHCYLKCWCGAHVSWDKTGSIQTASIPKPGSLPPLKDEGLMIKRPVAWNYYQNVVTSSSFTIRLRQS
ncbi:hypothetical protein K1719_013079 [Acacia pycnantha]|nr:hypothetical protein K1719_013079 [Acacia pycnantha]